MRASENQVLNTNYTPDIVMGAYIEKMLFNPYRNSMGVRILTPTSQNYEVKTLLNYWLLLLILKPMK